MKCSILEVSLLLVVLNPGTVGDGDDGDIPELVLSNGSSPVLLPCFHQSPTQIDAIQWIFQPVSGNNGMLVCAMDKNNPQCNSPRFPHITLAETEGFRTGNYSLLFMATMENAGNYDCSLYSGHQVMKKMEIRLLVINDPSHNSTSNIPVIAGVAVGVAVVVLTAILIGLLVKKKYKPAGQNSAPVQNNEDNYATINLDTLSKPGKGVTRSAEATVYAEVKTN